MNNQPILNHVAGPMMDNVQRCWRCGKVLIDARKANSKGGAPVAAFTEDQEVFVNGSIVGAGRDESAANCATPMSST
jgi:hypothetical protein